MSQTPPTVETILVSPAEILLDPNSYRLVDDPFWEPVPDQRIPEPQVQSRAFEAVLSESRMGLRELRSSLEVYGWIDIEPLWVRRLADGQLVAVDGNRRLVAWSQIFQPHRAQLSLFPDKGAAQKILVHVANQLGAKEASLQLGLRHLLPPTKWPPLGMAVWHDRHREAHGTLPDWGPYGRSLRWRLGAEDLALRVARRSEILWDPRGRRQTFYQLVELFSHPIIANWISPGNGEIVESRVALLSSWMVPREQGDRSDEEGGEFFGAGDKGSSRLPDSREIAMLLADPQALARLVAGAHPRELVDEANLAREVSYTGDYLHPLIDTRIAKNQPLDPGKVQETLIKLREALRRSSEDPVEPGTQHPWPLLEPERAVRLNTLTIKRYRGLKEVSLTQLKRINLLVGVNNAGKTSVLEALYLLSRLSDPRGLLDALRVRTRWDPERNPSLLSQLIERLEIDIEASDTNQREPGVRLVRLPTPEGADLSTHIPGMRLDATVGRVRHVTTTELSSQRPRRTLQVEGESAWLARAVLHSPYSRPDRSAIMRWYEESVETGVLSAIVAALRDAVDPGLVDVRLVSESGRFIVEHRDRPVMDISAYGEGLQRVFEIGLLFAAHRGGFVLVDELETAIHPGAMLRFTRLILKLAVDCDVQVFITTHSKETVDAFLFNGGNTEDIAAYLLKRADDGRIDVRRFGGPELKRAVEVGDVDLRRL